MKNIVGYQIVSNDGKNELPSCFYSFEYFADIMIAETWLELEKSNPEHGEFKWVLYPVFEGDIEDPKVIECI